MVNESIDRRAIDFPGKDPAEEFQFFFHQHWIRLWWPLRTLLLWMLACIVGLAVTANAFDTSDAVLMRHVLLTAFVVLFCVAQIIFLTRFYKYFLYVIIVTDKKIHRIKKTMLTVDDHQSIDLWNLEDITKNQHGIIQNALGFGTLQLMMQNQDVGLKIHFTPFINKKHELIMQLREHARGRMTPQRQLKQQMEAHVEETMQEVEQQTHHPAPPQTQAMPWEVL
jgi:hypothetical protein